MQSAVRVHIIGRELTVFKNLDRLQPAVKFADAAQRALALLIIPADAHLTCLVDPVVDRRLPAVRLLAGIRASLHKGLDPGVVVREHIAEGIVHPDIHDAVLFEHAAVGRDQIRLVIFQLHGDIAVQIRRADQLAALQQDHIAEDDVALLVLILLLIAAAAGLQLSLLPRQCVVFPGQQRARAGVVKLQFLVFGHQNQQVLNFLAAPLLFYERKNARILRLEQHTALAVHQTPIARAVNICIVGAQSVFKLPPRRHLTLAVRRQRVQRKALRAQRDPRPVPNFRRRRHCNSRK